MVFVLISILILMIATEKSKIYFLSKKGLTPSILGMLFASFVFFISGIFGLIIFNIQVESPIGLSAPVLFPALSGLFGMPTLLTSIMSKPTIPKQRVKEPFYNKKANRSSILSIITGSLGGIFVSIIPGITSSIGTVIAMNARGESDKRQTLVTLSAVRTACAFFIVVIMFITLKPRSGATIAVGQLISIKEWATILMPSNLAYFLIAILVGGTLSYFLTLIVGKLFAKNFSKIPYNLIIKVTIVLVTVLVFLFTNVIGLIIFVVAIFIGLLPVHWGVRRSHCMGVLLLPVILYFL